MRWIGLTGCMGCGKSTVARILMSEHGLSVLSADEVALNILQSDEGLHNFVREHMQINPPVQTGSKDEDLEAFTKYRSDIAAKVFGNKKLLESYEAFFHPKIKARVQELKDMLSKTATVGFYDVPLLFEKNMQNDFDAVVGVFADADIQVERLKKRNNWSDQEIATRLGHQISNAEKSKMCDFVLTNNSDLEDLKKQVTQLVAKLTNH